MDEAIEKLGLRKNAKLGAYVLKSIHPTIRFISGRRGVQEQASAMAANIIKSKNRQWIAQTYAKSTIRNACQTWVDNHPKAITKTQLTDGFLEVLGSFGDDDHARLSKHFSGDAFDVEPQIENADQIKANIKGLSGLQKFLDREGNLEVWHAQFT